MPPTAVALKSGAGSPILSSVVIVLMFVPAKLSRLMALRNPLRSSFPGNGSRHKTTLHQISSGRSLPINHFAGTKHPGKRDQHQVVGELVPRHAAGTRNCLRNRSGTLQDNSTPLNCRDPITQSFRMSNFFDQGGRGGT